MDNRILATVSRDLVTAEGHYRRSCYRLYTKEDALKEVLVCDEHEDAEAQYEAAVNNNSISYSSSSGWSFLSILK